MRHLLTSLRQSQPRHGFSLIELLLVLTLIVLLMGLVAAALAKLRDDSNVRETQMLLKRALNASTEYQARTQTIINHEDNSPVNWNSANLRQNDPAAESFGNPGSMGSPNDSDDHVYIERFVWAAQQVPSAELTIRTLADNLHDTDGDGFLEIIDGWENSIDYRTQTTSSDELPLYPRPFFASAGADAKFGDSQPHPDEEAEDNMYSYNVD